VESRPALTGRCGLGSRRRRGARRGDPPRWAPAALASVAGLCAAHRCPPVACTCQLCSRRSRGAGRVVKQGRQSAVAVHARSSLREGSCRGSVPRVEHKKTAALAPGPPPCARGRAARRSCACGCRGLCPRGPTHARLGASAGVPTVGPPRNGRVRWGLTFPPTCPLPTSARGGGDTRAIATRLPRCAMQPQPPWRCGRDSLALMPPPHPVVPEG